MLIAILLSLFMVCPLFSMGLCQVLGRNQRASKIRGMVPSLPNGVASVNLAIKMEFVATGLFFSPPLMPIFSNKF